jgi:hypothetical protein
MRSPEGGAHSPLLREQLRVVEGSRQSWVVDKDHARQTSASPGARPAAHLRG